MGRNQLRAGLVAVAALLWCAPSVRAQQGTATVLGTVKDASSDAAVGDVIVTVRSPSLQGESTAVTDATGSYRIQGLPPGTYELVLDKPGFEPYTHEAIELRADNATRVNGLLLPAAVQQAQEIIVVGHAPVIDVENASTGANASSSFTSRVPMNMPGSRNSASNSFEAVAELAPGAHPDFYGVSISGTTSPENQYLIDGLSVRNPVFGVLGTPLSLDFIKEVSVISGGYMPEYGRANGGVLNAITKSGSNEVHGSVFGSITPGALEGHRTRVKREGQTIVTEPSLSYMGDIGTDVGGPIVHDKLWFYAGFDWAKTRYRLHRSLYRTLFDSSGMPRMDDGTTLTEKVADTDEDFYAQQDILQFIGKLDWAADKRNRLTLTTFGTPTFSGGGGDYGINPLTAQPEIGTGTSSISTPLIGSYGALAHKYTGGSLNALLKWSNQLDGKRLLLDTSLGWHHETGGRAPSDGSAIGSSSGLAGLSAVQWQRINPPHSIADFEKVPHGGCNPPAGKPHLVPCPVSDYRTGGPDFINHQVLNLYQGRSVLTYNFEGGGHHVLKTGLEVELATYDHQKAYSGARTYQEQAEAPFFLDLRQFGYLSGPDQPVFLNKIDNSTKSVTAGGFVQDNWYVTDEVTVNLGLRYDTQLLYSADGDLAMTLPNQWSPRAGAVYDPTAEGESKIYANYARYYESVPLDVIDRTVSGEPLLYAAHDPSMCNPLSKKDQMGACLAPGNYLPFIGNPPNANFAVVGAGKTPIDPDLRASSNDEVVLGAEYEIIRDGRLGLNYTKRWLNAAIEDMSRDEGQTYFIGNPGYGIAGDFPKAVRRYDAVTAYFEKVFSYHWLGSLSYTASYLRGNYAGLFRSEDLQIDPNMNSDFDLKSLTVNRSGPLPGDHTHAIKLFAARDIPVGERSLFTVGGAVRALSGGPTSYLGLHPMYGPDQIYILPRGSGDRLPWVFSGDLRVAYGFKITPTDILSITCDIFNLFNFQAATQHDQRYTVAPVSPVTSGGIGALKNADGTPFAAEEKNSNFGRAIEYQPPRIFRFGLRMTY